MKVTSSQLKQFIKEEIIKLFKDENSSMLNEIDDMQPTGDMNKDFETISRYLKTYDEQIETIFNTQKELNGWIRVLRVYVGKHDKALSKQKTPEAISDLSGETIPPPSELKT